jgi:Fic family protein
MERGRLSQPLLYLSAYIEKHRQDYYTLLQRVRTHGDWASWLRYFIHGVELIATDAVKRTTRLLDLRKQYQERVRARELYGTAPLIDELFVNPYVTVARAERVMKVSNPTARAAVKNLQGMKILKEITGRGWGRIYAADAVRKVIEEK